MRHWKPVLILCSKYTLTLPLCCFSQEIAGRGHEFKKLKKKRIKLSSITLKGLIFDFVGNFKFILKMYLYFCVELIVLCAHTCRPSRAAGNDIKITPMDKTICCIYRPISVSILTQSPGNMYGEQRTTAMRRMTPDSSESIAAAYLAWNRLIIHNVTCCFVSHRAQYALGRHLPSLSVINWISSSHSCITHIVFCRLC